MEFWCKMQIGCLVFSKYLGIHVLMNPWGLTTLGALKGIGDFPIHNLKKGAPFFSAKQRSKGEWIF
jgi:hypothetical protein